MVVLFLYVIVLHVSLWQNIMIYNYYITLVYAKLLSTNALSSRIIFHSKLTRIRMQNVFPKGNLNDNRHFSFLLAHMMPYPHQLRRRRAYRLPLVHPDYNSKARAQTVSIFLSLAWQHSTPNCWLQLTSGRKSTIFHSFATDAANLWNSRMRSIHPMVFTFILMTLHPSNLFQMTRIWKMNTNLQTCPMPSTLSSFQR